MAQVVLSDLVPQSIPANEFMGAPMFSTDRAPPSHQRAHPPCPQVAVPAANLTNSSGQNGLWPEWLSS